ncbi:hypothetical protein [Neolewinella antarctica]|uniref:Uncharacterized protein n=1 Tax=Neolewinella antarctica TaxID=442734 RepID=A0ABX0XCS7_9BACT|nr:hypothetical protein [Neolewinella antarctica]NJC27084.1 hypothetical protein [Neolewinella antarctica]
MDLNKMRLQYPDIVTTLEEIVRKDISRRLAKFPNGPTREDLELTDHEFDRIASEIMESHKDVLDALAKGPA